MINLSTFFKKSVKNSFKKQNIVLYLKLKVVCFKFNKMYLKKLSNTVNMF